MYDLLIKNGKIVTSEKVMEGNIAVKDGVIALCTKKHDIPAAKQVLDVSGKLVFPGAIDTHAHLNDPGYTWREDFEHGTGAAALGGYTTVIDMPLQNEPALTNASIFENKQKAVHDKSHTDYCFWGGLVSYNFNELKELWDAGAVAFKAFLGPVSADYETLNYGQAYEAMQIVRKLNGRIGFHCEDYSIIRHMEALMMRQKNYTWEGFLKSRPVAAEMVATMAVIEMAKAVGCKVHICHVSSPLVAAKIKEAQQQGYDITAETCGHYLSMTDHDVLQGGAMFKCAPPLRSQNEVDRLWEYVADGTLSGIASDHSPCTYEEKYTEILGKRIQTPFDAWGGISGIQSVFQTVFYEGVVKRGYSPCILAKVMSENAAKAFGIYGKKGAIAEGFDADFVILDPDRQWEITEESLYYVNKISAFTGRRGIGRPIATFIRGELAACEDKLIKAPGYGKLVKRI
ncbi:MAG: allantoinase AllB [Bacillota bacterium]|nr:allantoinase AllB [Bacillota bacterium]